MSYKKIIIFSFLVLTGIFAIYQSIYFEKLDAKKQRDRVKDFNPKELVDYFWKNQLEGVIKNAVLLEKFDSLLQLNPLAFAKKYGKTVGISTKYYFLVKGRMMAKKDESGNLICNKMGNFKYKLITKYLFCNTARDATGYFNVDNFQNTMDFNAVSTELNMRIIKEVIANKLDGLLDEVNICFVGAVEVNTESITNELEIVPLKLELLK